MQFLAIGGFKGAGKTTLLRRAARLAAASGRQVAIALNDFGREVLDAGEAARLGWKVRELPGGCICCQLPGLVHTAVQAWRREGPPDCVLIEASPIAAPALVRQALAPVLEKGDTLRVWWLAEAARVERFAQVAAPDFIEGCLRDADLVLLRRPGGALAEQTWRGREGVLAYGEVEDLPVERFGAAAMGGAAH